MSDPIGMGDEEEDDILNGGEGGSEPLAPSPMEPRVSGGGRPDAILQLLAQATRTGSQGAPRPSYAADIAGAQNRIAKILASGLKGLEETGGLERIGQAAMQTLAGQGRISFPQAEAAAQQQDLSRAYNIANALSGLAKSQGGGQLNQSQMLNLLMRGQEGDRRERANFARNTDAIARAASANLDNPAEGMAYIAQRMQELGANSETPLDKLTQIRTQAIGEMSRQRFRTKKEGKGGDGAGEFDPGGIKINDETGEVIERKRWVSRKGESLTQIQKDMNAALSSGNTSAYDRLYFDNEATLAAKAVRDELGTSGVKDLDKLKEAHKTAINAFNLFGQIDRQLAANPNVQGTIWGTAVSTLGGAAGAIQQAKGFVGSLLSATVQSGGPEAEGARRALAAINSPESSADISAALARVEKQSWFKSLLDQGADADTLKASIAALGYMNAAANDPGGRFSDRDVAAGIAEAAAWSSNPQSMRRGLALLRERYTNNMNSLIRVTPIIGESEGSWSPTRNLGAEIDSIRRPVRRRGRAAPAAGAPPAAAPQQPSGSNQPTPPRYREGQRARHPDGTTIEFRNGVWERVQ
jgi:hypothetical protein